MGITITENSKELVSRLIRKEFDEIDLNTEYIFDKGTKLIQAAIEYGLIDLANEMQSDLRIEKTA